jgi:ferredoxin-nitrite reductase
MSAMDEFSEEQKLYLQGFVSGLEIARSRGGAAAGATGAAKPSGPEAIHLEAQDRFTAAGKKLVPEEVAKRKAPPLDMWDELVARAAANEAPKGTDVFRTKFHGLFYVAPAQNSFMCRLRIPCGIINAHQFRAVADLAETCGGGYSHVTTRANLQIREIEPKNTVRVLNGLAVCGLTSRGSGADNIRNITGHPTSGIDALELYDVRELCADMHHHILNHRELYGLPRKFNIAFDGGGAVSTVADTNDIGFFAVRVEEGQSVPAGIYFRMELGGITGHRDFSRDAGWLLTPEQCVPAAAAVVRVFIAHGDRTDRTKARMKYVLDTLGHEAYLAESEKLLSFKPLKVPLEACAPRPAEDRWGHVDWHAQKQPGMQYVGVVLPAGLLTVEQMRGLAGLAARHGDGDLRLTVWQNLLLSGIPDAEVEAVKAGLKTLGLDWRASSVRAGLIACTGNSGCKFAASDTKRHAAAIADYLEPRVTLDQPVNIHLTGCHHSCAQHYIGDIGLLAAKISGEGDTELEGYHVYVGGGYGAERGIAAEFQRDVVATEVPALIERLLKGYLAHRVSPAESFRAFTARHGMEALRALIDAQPVAA